MRNKERQILEFLTGNKVVKVKMLIRGRVTKDEFEKEADWR